MPPTPQPPTPYAGTKRLQHLRNACIVLCFLNVLTGLVSSGFTVAALVQKFGGEQVTNSLYLMLVANLGLTAAGVLGIAGLRNGSSKLLTAWFILMVIVALLYVGTVVYTHLNLTELRIKVAKAIKNFMMMYGSYLGRYHNGDATLDEMQKNRGCCGVQSPLEWKTTKYAKIPDSCCAVSKDCNIVTRRNISFQAAYTILVSLNQPMRPVFHDCGCVGPMTALPQSANDVIIPSSLAISSLCAFTYVLMAVYCCVLHYASL
ncbi:hypothetical protein RvY_14292-2 [Ramazzottius varieornatus]|uniref:Tetraspanin n=1 Tax=Ramazzottius varieornatus TaxID=947166 RepID=A0A1D1VZ87_RAMVA|nr:hypothetical protein RvY_14292-2 [Ramazzottius varieornatus]